MSLKFKAGFWGVVVGQLLLLMAMIGMSEYTLLTGTSVVLQTVPVDPRSILQGDYAILQYEIATLPEYLGHLPPGSTVYVTLVEGEEVWRADYYTAERPPEGTVFIRGNLDRSGRLDFGIGTYFVPEGTGHIIERAGDLKVRVAVDDDGRAVIQEVLVDGRPFNPDEVAPSGADSPPDRPAPVEAPPPPPGTVSPEGEGGRGLR